MPKFRKKPVVIEAFQWNGEEVPGFQRLVQFSRPVRNGTISASWAVLVIPTLEGDMHASIGDWIITGVKGEKYPCKPDIFRATYERVEGE